MKGPGDGCEPAALPGQRGVPRNKEGVSYPRLSRQNISLAVNSSAFPKPCPRPRYCLERTLYPILSVPPKTQHAVKNRLSSLLVMLSRSNQLRPPSTL